MNKGNIYRLKDGKTPLSYGLPQNEIGIVKPGEGFKFINYYPGSDSIYVDDNKDRKVGKVTFEFNDLDATEVVVSEHNLILNRYMKAHPYFGVHYEIFSEELDAQSQLDEFDKKEKALFLIKETDEFKVQAIALAILGMEAFGWSSLKCKAKLKEIALTNPSEILEKVESTNYESKYLSALSFFSGILRENNMNSAVVWNDENQGVVLHLAKGENGIAKLGELLSFNTDESRLILQEIDIRLEKLNPKKEVKKVAKQEVDSSALLAEIAELKAMLAQKNKVETSTDKGDNIGLEVAKKDYLEKFEKEVPVNKKNDLPWILERLKE
jgi:hypothetical protein